MRSFSNFLLFEGVLEDQPADRRTIKQISDALATPTVKVVTEDCHTLLGDVTALSFELIGKTELATGMPLTELRIQEILASGKYTVSIRSLHHCTAEGGICRKCYNSQYLVTDAPAVGEFVTLDSAVNYQSDYLATNVGGTMFTVSQADEEYDYSVALLNGNKLTDGIDYIIKGGILQLVEEVQTTDSLTVHFFRETTEGLLGYIARSYSGGLLGIKPLPTLPTIIRESLYPYLLDPDIVQLMRDELALFKNVPVLFLEYADRIPDILEKTLLLCYIYSLYANLD